MSASLAPYVSRLALDWLRDRPDEIYRRIDGTLVFADVSGFTAMSERLAGLGRRGAEELTHHLDDTFSALLDVAASRGGSLLKFGGDALLLFFTGDDHAVRGVAAAAEMRSRLRQLGQQQTSAGTVRLRMSMGAHSGPTDFFLVGGPHRDLVVAGPAASTVAAMEEAASAGEIVVSPALAAQLRPSAVGAAKGSGLLLTRPPRVSGSHPIESSPGDFDASSLLSPPLRAYLSGAEPEGEHRWLTVTFVHIGGIDGSLASVGGEATARAVRTELSAMQEVLAAHGVTSVDSDLYTDGLKVLAVAGAPVAYENDTERMVRALLDVRDATADGPLTTRAGVNHGLAFVGAVGPGYRRSFTVMGDAVNTAARLMAHAQPGEVLALRTVLERTETVFQAEQRPSFVAKGKAEPLTPSLVQAGTALRRVARGARLTLVGRDEELARLRGLVGRAAVVEVVAAKGMGKTRLLEELAAGAPCPVFRATASEYEASTPFALVQPLLRQALGLGEGVDPAARLTELVPTARPWLPLVGRAVGYDLGSTVEVDLLDPPFLAARLASVVSDLARAAQPGPVMLLVDNGEWVDDASSQLLRRLAVMLPGPWLVCVARRPGQAGLQIPGAEEMALDPLTTDAAAALARAASGDQLTPEEVDRVTARAGGNPLFVRDLSVATADAPVDTELPDEIEALLAARIDQLPAERRHAVRAASVLGPEFATPLLERVVPGWRRAGLEELIELSGDVARFRDRLDQEAAYAGLSFRRRQELHRLAGESIEAAGDPDNQLEVLSRHFTEGRDWARAWDYSMKAGQRAMAAYANLDAAVLFGRATEAAAHLPVTREGLAEAWSQLAYAYHRSQRFAEAIATATRGRRALRGDPIGRSRLAMTHSEAARSLGDARTAVAVLRTSLRELRPRRDDAAGARRSRVQAELATALLFAGRSSDALGAALTACDEADAAGDERALALGQFALCDLLVRRGDYEEAEKYQALPLRVFAEVGALSQLCGLQNLIAIADRDLGRWDAALRWLGEAADSAERAGDLLQEGMISINRGLILLDQGRLADATVAIDIAAAAWNPARYRPGLAMVDMARGRAAALEGSVELATALLDGAATALEGFGLATQAAWARVFLAEGLAWSGEPKDALAAAVDAARRLEDGEDDERGAQVARARAVADARQGRWAECSGALRVALDLAPTEILTALTLHTWAQLAAHVGEPPIGWRQTTDATFRRLGVVWLPEVPGGQPVAVTG